MQRYAKYTTAENHVSNANRIEENCTETKKKGGGDTDVWKEMKENRFDAIQTYPIDKTQTENWISAHLSWISALQLKENAWRCCKNWYDTQR